MGGGPWYWVTASVKVELNPAIPLVSTARPSNLTLQSTVWGIDGVGLDLFNKNDHLFNFPDQKITQGGDYIFGLPVHSSVLNEDNSWFDKNDEIGATINVVNSDITGPRYTKVLTPIIRGQRF